MVAPGRSGCDFKNVIFNLVLLIGLFRSSYVNVLRWMPQDLTDDKSTLVQVMAWCHQATSHYLNQCWQRSPMPYGITRPQWVKTNGLDALSHYSWWHWFIIFSIISIFYSSLSIHLLELIKEEFWLKKKLLGILVFLSKSYLGQVLHLFVTQIVSSGWCPAGNCHIQIHILTITSSLSPEPLLTFELFKNFLSKKWDKIACQCLHLYRQLFMNDHKHITHPHGIDSVWSAMQCLWL